MAEFHVVFQFKHTSFDGLSRLELSTHELKGEFDYVSGVASPQARIPQDRSTLNYVLNIGTTTIKPNYYFSKERSRNWGGGGQGAFDT